MFFTNLWFVWNVLILSLTTWSLPSRYCPLWMKQNGIIRDMAFLSDVVSWEEVDKVEGVCSDYHLVYEKDGLYDTRMRIFSSQDETNLMIVFRPTQQNSEAEQIHQERQLAECTFLPSCVGRVHARFQEAFLSLIEDDPWKDHVQEKKNIFTTGHSLGGSLQLFMALYLRHVLRILPHYSIGFAGPMIGDSVFTKRYLLDFQLTMNERWWQVETINKETMEFDGTVETYQVGMNELTIPRDSICGFEILPLPIPSHAYGMHDLKQYLLYLQGCVCEE